MATAGRAPAGKRVGSVHVGALLPDHLSDPSVPVVGRRGAKPWSVFREKCVRLRAVPFGELDKRLVCSVSSS